MKVGEPIRIFVVNAGPNVWSSFHVVGAIFDKAYINANPKNELHGLQSITIGPGDGACVEFTVEEPGHYLPSITPSDTPPMARRRLDQDLVPSKRGKQEREIAA